MSSSRAKELSDGVWSILGRACSKIQCDEVDVLYGTQLQSPVKEQEYSITKIKNGTETFGNINESLFRDMSRIREIYIYIYIYIYT